MFVRGRERESGRLIGFNRRSKMADDSSGDMAMQPHSVRPQVVTQADEESPLINKTHESSVRFAGLSISRLGLSRSLQRLRSATMTVSLIERPSDDRRASAWMAGWNVTNLIQGTGILGIPYAVRMGGWTCVAAIMVCGVICCFTGKLLIDCLYEESKRTGQRKRVRTNYPEIGGAAWPRWGNSLVSAVQVCEMSGIGVTYLVLLATVFHDLLQHSVALDIYEWTVVCACVVLPGIFITRVSIIAWISMVSVFALMLSLAVMITYAVTEFKHMSIANMPGFQLDNTLVGFGVVVFSYTAHAVFPGVEGSMREPLKFPVMMNVSFAFSAVVKVVLGVLCVLRFGAATNQAITVNMKTSAVFYYLSNALVVTNVMLAFPLVMFVVLETWDDKMLPRFPHLARDSRWHWFWLLLTRPLLFSFGTFLAISVPHFGLVMGLLGSVTGSCLCFVFPCLFHMKLKWKQLAWYQVLVRSFVVVFGVGCGGLGAVFTGKELAAAVKGF